MFRLQENTERQSPLNIQEEEAFIGRDNRASIFQKETDKNPYYRGPFRKFQLPNFYHFYANILFLEVFKSFWKRERGINGFDRLGVLLAIRGLIPRFKDAFVWLLLLLHLYEMERVRQRWQGRLSVGLYSRRWLSFSRRRWQGAWRWISSRGQVAEFSLLCARFGPGKGIMVGC